MIIDYCKRIIFFLCLIATYPVCFGDEVRYKTTSTPYWPSLRNEAPAGKEIKLSNAEIKKLRSGDIIFRLSYGYWSFVSEQYDGRWSHVGVLDVNDDEVFVIHSHGADETHKFSGVQKEPLSQYLRESREIKVMRFAKDEEEGKRFAMLAASLIGKGFDAEFDLENDKYYCSEVVLSVKRDYFMNYTQNIRPKSLTTVAQLSARVIPDSLQVITISGIEKAINDSGGFVVLEKKLAL